jgi:hypothetical protein
VNFVSPVFGALAATALILTALSVRAAPRPNAFSSSRATRRAMYAVSRRPKASSRRSPRRAGS